MMDNNSGGTMATTLMERRKLEIFLSLTTGGFGAFLLLPAVSMGTPAFEYIVADISENGWGLAFLLNGAAHITALAVNGSRWWSPMVRCWASIYSTILYGVLAGGFMMFSFSTTAVWTYSSLTIGSAIAAYWAWRDSIRAVRLRSAIAHNT